jgi:hypothetical protein
VAIQTRNLVMGPAVAYYAPMGTAEPADASVADDGWLTAPPYPWRDLGGTNGGVTVEIDSTLTAFEVDQMPLDPGARVTALKMSVTTPLAEISDENIAAALNNMVQRGSGTGYVTLDVLDGLEATQPGYSALIIDGWAPETEDGAPALRRCIVRKVLNQAKVSLTSDKKSQQKIECTWNVYSVGGGVRPVHIVSATA